MVMLGIDLRIRRFTPAAARLLGLLPGDVGRPLGNLRLSLEGASDIEAIVVDVIDQVRMQEREVRGRDGRWYVLRVHPYRTADNRIDVAVLVLADVHDAKTVQAELRESRDYVQAAFESARDPQLVLDARLRVRMANPAFYRTFGMTPRQTEGKPLYALGDRQWDIPALRTALEEILPGRASIEDFEVRADFDSLGPKVMLLSAHHAVRGEQQDETILLEIHDRTDSVRLEDELRSHAAQLAEADRRKDEFLALLSHELRNPVAPIRHLLEVAKLKRARGQPLETELDSMERQVAHLIRLLDDLLDVTRITQGRIEIRRSAIELTPVVDDAIDTIRPVCDRLEIGLTVSLPPGPVLVNADQTRLAQILGNLLNNACKFTDRGGSISLSVEEEGPQVVIRVRDNGIGISAEDLPRIFDMFMQVDTSLERSRQGLGVGLTLVKYLVQAHDGTIEVHSAGPGRGSEFVVRLPRLPAPA
jgi:two-component system CheB/CheR fusion protein